MHDDNRLRAAAGSGEIAFGDILKLLLSRFHWVLLAGVVAAALVYTAITVFVTPTYQSRVSFYVYNSASNAAHDTINNSDLQAAESLAATYSKILESNSVLDSVLADIRGETALSRKELNRMVRVSVISDTQLLEVVVTSADPKLACRIADAFAKVAPTEIIRITKAGGVEVVDRPEVASEKTAPRTGFDSAIGFVLGVIVISVILVLRMLADTTIYLPENLAQAADVTMLAAIPEINIADDAHTGWILTEGETAVSCEKESRSQRESRDGPDQSKRLLTKELPFAIKEAYVKLRTSLLFCMTADEERPCSTFAVTSAKPSEGKSLTAANIAISYAMLGKRVLLVDADMRKAGQRSLWSVRSSAGLCDFLAKISRLELAKVTDLPLWIVCTGTIPPNPSELLSSERMRRFAAENAETYDYVIIDTPPINTVADAQIISTYVDGVVLVTRSGVTTTDELNDAKDAVLRAGGNLCGVVLNDMNMKSGKYAHKHKYKYGGKYGYKYSYSDPYEAQ